MSVFEGIFGLIGSTLVNIVGCLLIIFGGIACLVNIITRKFKLNIAFYIFLAITLFGLYMILFAV